MGFTKLLVAGASVVALSACSTVRQGFMDRQGAYTRNLPDLNDIDARQFAERQNNLWNCFVAMAQAEVAEFKGRQTFDNRHSDYDCGNHGAAPNVVKSVSATAASSSSAPDVTVGEVAVPEAARPAVEPATASLKASPTFIASSFATGTIAGKHPAYSEVVAAGIHYADVRCERYMDALVHFNRIRETSSRQVNFAGAASAAALTILKASTELIGLAPLGFGLVDQTINNVGRGLLYDLPPHVVKQLVERQQEAYLKAVAKEYTSRPHAMQAIQGYATLCLPSTIENEVNRAIAATEYDPVAWENPTARADWGKDDKGKDGKPALDEKTDEGTPPPNNLPKVKQKDGDDDD
jgi:hypothetical protein